MTNPLILILLGLALLVDIKFAAAIIVCVGIFTALTTW